MSIKQLFDLTGRTALVTGGSRGLGLQIAEALGEQGARLVLSSRKQDELDEAVAHLKGMGVEATAVVADLGTTDGAQTLVDRGDEAPRPDRHPRQQRRRELGRAGRGSSARGVGEGDEPQRARHLPDEPGGRPRQHDPAQVGPHHQRRVDRRPARQRAGHDADARVQHEQGRGRQLHARARRRMGSRTTSTSTRSRRASSRRR